MHVRDRRDRATRRAEQWANRLESATDELMGITRVYTTDSHVLGKNPTATLEAAEEYKNHCFKNYEIWKAAQLELGLMMIDAEERGTAEW